MDFSAKTVEKEKDSIIMEVKVFIDNYREAFGEKAELPIAFWYSDIPLANTEKINGCFFKGMKTVRLDYFRNRVVTHSTSSGSTTSRTASSSKSVTGINYSDLIQTNRLQTTRSVGTLTASGYSISYSDEKVVCIPPKTSKIITEYNINETLYRDCDLFKYPTKKQINSKTFSRNNSPIVFSNRITYSLENSDKRVKFENEFYVSEISNYPESELIELKNDEYCGQKSTIKTRYFKNVAPDKFYIRYTKGTDIWKH